MFRNENIQPNTNRYCSSRTSDNKKAQSHSHDTLLCDTFFHFLPHKTELSHLISDTVTRRVHTRPSTILFSVRTRVNPFQFDTLIVHQHHHNHSGQTMQVTRNKKKNNSRLHCRCIHSASPTRASIAMHKRTCSSARTMPRIKIQLTALSSTAIGVDEAFFPRLILFLLRPAIPQRRSAFHKVDPRL